MKRLAMGVSILLFGCPGTLDDPERFATPFKAPADAATDGATAACPDVPQAVFAANCTQALCHNPTDIAGQLDLASPAVGSRLRGRNAWGGSGVLVDPVAPEQSVIYLKLTPTPPFGARMPNIIGLDPSVVACVGAWVEAAANAAPGPDGGADAD